MKALPIQCVAFLICLSALGLQSAFAKTKTVDARTYISDREAKHYLIFASRGGSITGHAFVVWREVPLGPSAIQDRAFGLYPKDRSLIGQASSLAPVEGELLDDKESFAHATNQLVVQVDEGQWQKSEQERHVYETNPPYMLGADDCVAFVEAIGRSIDLVVPDRGVPTPMPQGLVVRPRLPQPYIEDLVNDIDRDYDIDLGNGNSYHGQSIVRGANYVPYIWAFGKGTYRSGKGTVLSGNFRYGVLDGPGKYTQPDGTGFEGTLVAGNPVNGKWTNKNGTYTGPLLKPNEHAKAQAGFPNGDVYDGDIDDHGRFDGSGTYYVAQSKLHISGTFIGGLYVGTMTVSFPDGARATVHMSAPASSLNGPMEYTAADGRIGTGEWAGSRYTVRLPNLRGGGSTHEHSSGDVDHPTHGSIGDMRMEINGRDAGPVSGGDFRP